MERALAEATPLEKAGIGAPSSPGDRARARHSPVVTKGVAGTMPGTDPFGALLAKESTHERQRKSLQPFARRRRPSPLPSGAAQRQDDEQDADDDRRRRDE
jgi:hypothetical protein